MRQRLQMYGSVGGSSNVSAKEYDNTFHAVRHIWKTESWRGLFVSVQSAVIRDAPYALFYFSTYEMMKEIQRRFLGVKNGGKMEGGWSL